MTKLINTLFFLSLSLCHDPRRTWRLKDLCYSPSFPNFDIQYIDQVSILLHYLT